MRGILRAGLWIALAGGSSLFAQSGTTDVTNSSSNSTTAQESVPEAPTPVARPVKVRVVDWKFRAVTGTLFAASIADAETLYGCDNCTIVPAAMHRRGFTYGAGLPIDVAVSYFSYAMKKKGYRWWYVPSLALAATNGYLAYHWKASTDSTPANASAARF